MTAVPLTLCPAHCCFGHPPSPPTQGFPPSGWPGVCKETAVSLHCQGQFQKPLTLALAEKEKIGRHGRVKVKLLLQGAGLLKAPNFSQVWWNRLLWTKRGKKWSSCELHRFSGSLVHHCQAGNAAHPGWELTTAFSLGPQGIAVNQHPLDFELVGKTKQR